MQGIAPGLLPCARVGSAWVASIRVVNPPLPV